MLLSFQLFIVLQLMFHQINIFHNKFNYHSKYCIICKYLYDISLPELPRILDRFRDFCNKHHYNKNFTDIFHIRSFFKVPQQQHLQFSLVRKGLFLMMNDITNVYQKSPGNELETYV